MNNEAIKKYTIIPSNIELLLVLLIYSKIKKLPMKAHIVQGINIQIVNEKFNWPAKENKNVLAIAVVIIKKFEVDELSFGSSPSLANIGLVIIPPPIPTIEEIIPAKIATKTTFTK